MGIFDRLKNAAVGSVSNAVSAAAASAGNKRETFTLDRKSVV